jgi:RNA polymerase sigma-70 factor (ECF subfamily)
MNMPNSLLPEKEVSLSQMHGKLYAGLLHTFGSAYLHEIEDAIQTAFLKWLQRDKVHQTLLSIENWLYIVARNELLSHIRRQKSKNFAQNESLIVPFEETPKDLRLQILLFIASCKNVKHEAKITFVLKNIFGLTIQEIIQVTLLNEDALYKSLQRTKQKLAHAYQGQTWDLQAIQPTKEAFTCVEELLYAVFALGLDSFDEKAEKLLNKELCLEAFALVKYLYVQHPSITTKHLLALFCFHLARLPAKIEQGKFIPFFKQDRQKWDQSLWQLGFHYLQKPKQANKYYLEAVIVCKFMTTQHWRAQNWSAIGLLYQEIQRIAPSPMIQLHISICLFHAGKTDEARSLLAYLEEKFPKNHFYFALVKANMLEETNPSKAKALRDQCVLNLKQKIRIQYLTEFG